MERSMARSALGAAAPLNVGWSFRWATRSTSLWSSVCPNADAAAQAPAAVCNAKGRGERCPSAVCRSPETHPEALDRRPKGVGGDGSGGVMAHGSEG